MPVWLRLEHNGHDGLVSFDIENLPHGVIVSDIGLNGVLIPEKETQRRQVFLKCACGCRKPTASATPRPAKPAAPPDGR